MAEKFREELKTLYPHRNKFRVVIAGTFDILHNGHIYLIQEAAKIGDVYVIVARDSSVKKYKGRAPILPEEQRLDLIRYIKGVKGAKLGSEDGKLVRVVELNPDIFILGPNQYGNLEKYQSEMKKLGFKTIFRRLPNLDNRFELNSSTKIKKKIAYEYSKKVLND